MVVSLNGKYKTYEECTPGEKKEIKEYDEKIRKIISSKDEKYDKKGQVRCWAVFPDIDPEESQYIELEMTPRQMAKAGILYDAPFVRWISNEEIEIGAGLAKKDPETVKSVLLNGDDEIVYVYTATGAHCSGVPTISRAMPKKLYELGLCNIGMPGSIEIVECHLGETDIVMGYENKCTLDEYARDYKERKEIAYICVEERQKKLERLTRKIKKDKTGKYDKMGVLSIPVYETNSRRRNFS